MRIVFCLVLFLFFYPSVYGQSRSGVVLDSLTNEPLAFVNVIFNQQPTFGTMTDMNGQFLIEDSTLVKTLSFSYIGYDDKMLRNEGNLTVKLNPSLIQLNEVVVTLREPTANSIIRKTILNKKRNNPRFLPSFQYKSYNKVTYDYVIADQTSKEAINLQKMFKGGALFVMESVTERRYIRPEISEEIVLATKVSGFKHPSFAALATDIQPFSFYEDIITVYDINYLNPISKGSLKRYQFKIEDTLFQSMDTTLILSFRPRKGKKFEALRGLLYINTKHFAIQNVIAYPNDKGLVDLKIQQEYKQVDNQWFPKQLNFELTLNPVSKTEGSIHVVGKSYFTELNLSPDFRKKNLSVSSFIMHEDSDARNEEYWNENRIYPLVPKEIIAYQVMDSVGRVLKFDAIIKLTEKLSVNKIGVGIFDLDIPQSIVYNNYEQTRLGLGLHTNEKMNKHISIGGFVGYGIKDKKWKYGGDLIWTLNKKHEFVVKAKYQDNLRETGRSNLNAFDRNQFDFRSLIAFRMDRIKQQGLSLEFRAFRFAKFKFSLNKTYVFPQYKYAFKALDHLDTLNYTSTDLNIAFRYAFAEKFYETKTDRISQGTKFPVLVLSYTKGLKGVLNGELNFSKFEASLSESIFIRNMGRLNVRLEGGFIDKPLPYGLLFSGDGSKGENWVSLWVPNYFQTVTPQAFLADQYVNLFLSHDFGSLFKIKKFSPIFVLHHNMGWGRLGHSRYHNHIHFSERNEGLFESGVNLDNLLKINILNVAYLGFGGGVFYRYGAYSASNWLENTALKISVRYTTK